MGHLHDSDCVCFDKKCSSFAISSRLLPEILQITKSTDEIMPRNGIHLKKVFLDKYS